MSMYREEKISELEHQKQDIREKMDNILSNIIQRMKAQNLNSVTAPQEYVQLDKECWKLDNQLWNIRSENQEIAYSQELILSIEDRIKIINTEIEKYKTIELLGIKISGSTIGDPIAFLEKEKDKLLEDIKSCETKINNLKK
ncbi:MAG: hypothetical protein IJ677_00115 [Alphaproteobacteria bacterium]|nr:hypothetical protein [Alphaproteobacteria bacterium]MBR1648347.1 hypothetical protein [Alphaproteobacteria bacterium]